MPKRDRPLTAAAVVAEAEMEALAHEVVVGPGATAPAAGGGESERARRLADGVRTIRVGGGTLQLSERLLLVLGGILAPLGLVAVLVGWYGASRTPNLYEQIPYAISGGLFGLGLVFLGAFLYFAHWLTELVKEHRAQSAAVVEAINRLEAALRPPAPAAQPEAPDVLVATGRGTMAHRPDCVVVAGKPDVRALAPGETLTPCKLCSN